MQKKLKNKDSGFRWLRQIPEEWDVSKVKYCFTRKNSKAEEENPVVLSLARDGVKIRDITTNEGQLAESYYNYNPVEPGDMLINPMDLYSGANCSLSKVSGVISPAYINLKNKIGLESRFFDYYFKYQYWSFAFFSYGKGVSYDNRWTLNDFSLMNFPLLVPSLDEQTRIADFLDSKCQKIDDTIEKINNQIEALKKYKQSLITEVVTKGLDKNVEMKDSEVNWIEQIPKNWRRNKIKYLFNNGKGLPITKADLVEDGVPVLSYGQIHAKTNSGVNITQDLIRYVDNYFNENYPSCEVFKNDFIFADTSEDYEGCGNCCYKRDDTKLLAGYHTIILHSKRDRDNRYYAYLFKTDCWRKQLREIATGVKLFSIAQHTIMNSTIIVPPELEQIKISDFLDNKCEKIDNILNKKSKQIEILEKYKKSLIYEYVIGKKRVK